MLSKQCPRRKLSRKNSEQKSKVLLEMNSFLFLVLSRVADPDPGVLVGSGPVSDFSLTSDTDLFFLSNVGAGSMSNSTGFAALNMITRSSRKFKSNLNFAL